jgi:CheY-like chemotaxis protein
MKTALIVDDSRVARAVLRKTLAEFDLNVDEASSAEVAFEHLKVERPDVIFLDHMMPGMDGLDALAILKANPSTATIPVLMYTAQEGQFYVSRARALGAVDVMPKTLEPADVERILRSHHLIGEPGWTLIDDGEPEADATRELLERFKDLLDERSVRLMAQFRREIERSRSAAETATWRMLEQLRPEPKRAFSPRVAIGGSIAAAAVVAAVGIPFMPLEPSRDELSAPTPVAATTTVEATAEDLLVPVAREAEASAEVQDIAFADMLARSRAMTQAYAFGATPLDDTLARDYALLFDQLKLDGFSGTVTFEIHEGRHCIDIGPDGAAHLAAPELPATSCDSIGSPGPMVGAELQSPMFAGMVEAATRDGRIRVDTVLHGTAEPIIEYPALDHSISAADWNAIANANQRISVRVNTDAADATDAPVAYLVH